LVDLKNGPIDTQGLLGGDAANSLGGLFGAKAGESASETQARVDEAKKTATDLTGLVRKKKAAPGPAEEGGATATTTAPAPAAGSDAATNGKRKASGTVPDGGESPKKVKVDE
jgi:HAT1-interacting factor 1